LLTGNFLREKGKFEREFVCSAQKTL
jgi:hypothetical protein